MEPKPTGNPRGPHAGSRVALALATLAWLAISASTARARNIEDKTPPPTQREAATVKAYFDRLEQISLLDVDTGDKAALARELAAAEKLLRDGAAAEAAVALYAIVESPRFTDFDDFVGYQNAEYYLAVALANGGAYDSALRYLARILSRGPAAPYWSPAHRRMVDIAIDTREFQSVLRLIEGVKLNQPIPPGAAGELAYLRARIAYGGGDFAAAEGELTRISRKSRMFSSALYLRGIMRTRRGEFTSAAEALCEIVDTPDDNKYTFVVDDRYFTIKDLARLGLARIAHEVGDYDDAYYHYFQIPDDSDRIPDALFEAAWSMYQKRELATARDLTTEFLREFPTSPLMPEARLLAGYVELADCKFTPSQTHYDRLIKDLQPIVNEIDRIRRSPELRRALFDQALGRWRAERADPSTRAKFANRTPSDRALSLLRLDPNFVRLHEAVGGLRRGAADSAHVVRTWRGLGKQLSATRVRTIATDKSFEQEDAADVSALVEDIARLREQVARARADLSRGVRQNTLPGDVAEDERKRLDDLTTRLKALEVRAHAAAESGDDDVFEETTPGLRPMVARDLKVATQLARKSAALRDRLEGAADRLARESIERLYIDTRRVLDKAKLGKIDAVIGQKRKLDIEVQDLAAGRYPVELHGRMWEAGLIGDDEEYWPFEGEYWADEYEGWR